MSYLTSKNDRSELVKQHIAEAYRPLLDVPVPPEAPGCATDAPVECTTATARHRRNSRRTKADASCTPHTVQLSIIDEGGV